MRQLAQAKLRTVGQQVAPSGAAKPRGSLTVRSSAVVPFEEMPEPSDELMQVLREVLAPMVRADQGELYLVEAGDGQVALHVGGRFSGCPGNTLVTRRIIEPLIGAVVPHARVRLTSGVLVPAGASLIAPS